LAKHKFNKEILYHFNCGKCNKWWSIADHHLLSKENKLICPYCGHKEEVEEDDIYKSNEKIN
tara:strand:+ start:3008 stop:3193 length:186 start_codon:yes stop_codon:yes gene_type:complete